MLGKKKKIPTQQQKSRTYIIVPVLSYLATPCPPVYRLPCPTHRCPLCWSDVHPKPRFILIRYRQNDDISFSHGFTYRRTKSKGSHNLPQFPISQHKPGHQVAWMASRCHAQNGREKYVQFLSQFINVKVFGGCGDKCEKGERAVRCWPMGKNKDNPH